MLARRDTWIEASRVRRFSPLQTLEDQSQAWGICCHSCTGREGLAPSWNTELQSLALCGLPEDSVLFRPTGHTGRNVSRCGLTPLPFGHHASTCASAASVSGSQQVISISRYISIAI